MLLRNIKMKQTKKNYINFDKQYKLEKKDIQIEVLIIPNETNYSGMTVILTKCILIIINIKQQRNQINTNNKIKSKNIK